MQEASCTSGLLSKKQRCSTVKKLVNKGAINIHNAKTKIQGILYSKEIFYVCLLQIEIIAIKLHIFHGLKRYTSPDAYINALGYAGVTTLVGA